MTSIPTTVPTRVAALSGLALAATLVTGSVADAATPPVTVTVNSLADSHPALPTLQSSETLADAIALLNASTPGGTIRFASKLSGTITLTGHLPAITSPIRLLGPGPRRLKISGEGLGLPVLTIDTLTGGATYIEGVTLTGGDAPANGGAINAQTSVAVEHAVLTHNHAAANGGAIAAASSLVVLGSTISDNTAAGWDGGILASGAQPGAATISRSTISGNQALAGGDGGAFLGEPTTIEDSTISGNTSHRYGAGVGFYAGTPVTVTESTISGNTVTGRPAAGGSIEPYAGGGIGEWKGAGTGRTDLTIDDSIVAGNHDQVGTGADVYLPSIATFGTPSVQFSLVGVLAGSGVIDPRAHHDIVGGRHPANARLGRLRSNGGPTETRLPSPASWAFGSGDAGLIPSRALPTNPLRDQRGLPRRGGVSLNGGDGTDIGATEIPKQTRALQLGNRELGLTTVARSVHVRRGQPLPVIYTVLTLPRPRHPRLHFKRLVLRIDGAPGRRVRHSPSGRLLLSTRHLRRGRHHLTATITVSYRQGHVTHTASASVRATIQIS